MAFTRNYLQRKSSGQRGITYYVHTDSGRGFTQQGWMPTPGSLWDTGQSQRLLLSSCSGRTHNYGMKGRKRVWFCSLQEKDNSEKPLPAPCSSPSRPIPDAPYQLLAGKSRLCFHPQGQECWVLRCSTGSPAAPELGRGTYLALQVHHGLLEGFGWSSLVVAQNGHRSVGTVVGEDLCWDVVISCEGQQSAEQGGSPGCAAPASVPQSLQHQPSHGQPQHCTPATVPSLATSIPAPDSFWMSLITTDTISTQQRGSTAMLRAGHSRTTLPRTLLGFPGPTCPLGEAARCKAMLLTEAVDEQPRKTGLFQMHLPCLVIYSTSQLTKSKQVW